MRIPVTVGILAFRDTQLTQRRWQPTIDHLNQTIPTHAFTLRALHMSALTDAMAAGELDFILTQPVHFANMRGQYDLSATATLMIDTEEGPKTSFGGVIFTRANRDDINRLTDVTDKRVAAILAISLGAFRIQQWTFLTAGVDLIENNEVIFTGQPHDRAVEAVLSGEADVGFVRTGVLEAMVREGSLDMADLKIINAQTDSSFPLTLSTDLVPEWPFAAGSGISESLRKAVTSSLYSIYPDSEAARIGRYHGFAPPANYHPLEGILLRLGALDGQEEDSFDFNAFLVLYGGELAFGVIVLLGAGLGGVLTVVSANRRLRQANRERSQLLSTLGDGIYGIDRRGLCTFINPSALDVLGYDETEVIGQNCHSLFHHHHRDGQVYPHEECPTVQTLQDGQHRRLRDSFIHRDGHHIPVSLTATALTNGEDIIGAVVVFRDISDTLQREEDTRLSAVAFETNEAIAITDAENRFVKVNRAFESVTGYAASEVLGRNPSFLASGMHNAQFYREMWEELAKTGYWQGEIWNRRKNREVFPELLSITVVRDDHGTIINHVATFMDITERKRSERAIHDLAFYDSLTRLPNRQLLMERITQAMVTSTRTHAYGAVMLLDLDHFKILNDTEGHFVGDAFLRRTAERIKSSVRAKDTTARLGGDEFVVLLEELGETAETAATNARNIGDKILTALAEPYSHQKGDFHGSASLGVTLFQGDEVNLEDLLKRSDLALYQAKANGRNTLQFFENEMQATVEQQAVLESQLRVALSNDQFLLHFQPQVNIHGQIIGAEALIRWLHPERGLVGPGDFIDAAERSRLIVPIGSWVLNASCAVLRDWRDDPKLADLSIAVNVSAKQFRETGFVDEVRYALQEHALDPYRLKLELTESMLVDDIEGTIETMYAIKDLGVRLSIDDFGTGFSSLNYLKRLPIDQVKIDQSFVRDMLTDANDAAIVRMVIALGRTFGLDVIAEGVETKEQWNFLRVEGCDACQGWLFGRPVPAIDLASRVQTAVETPLPAPSGTVPMTTPTRRAAQ